MPPGAAARTGLWWVREVIKFPFRLMGLLILVGLIPGSFLLWRLPTLADNSRVELTLLTLRAVDEDKFATPLAPLGYRPTIKKHMVEFEPEGANYHHMALTVLTANFYRLCAVDQTCQQRPDGGLEYTISYNFGAPRTVKATTPHLDVSQEDLARARQSVAAIYPGQWQEVLDWGECLFWTEWWRQNDLFQVPARLIPDPHGGTEDERVWLVWQVLRGSDQSADAELPRLGELFEQAFPKQEDRQAAMTWARELFERMEGNFHGHQIALKNRLDNRVESARIEAWDGGDHSPVLVKLKRVLPPRTEWTYQWLVYRYVGLSEPSRAAAQQHWLSQFPAGARDRLLNYGAKIAQQRRFEGEALPPVPANLPLLCAVERLTGSDPYGRYCYDLIHREFGTGSGRGMLQMSINFGYPNDEIFFLQATRDPLSIHPFGGNNPTLTGKLERLTGAALVPLVGGLGFITLIQWIIVPLLVRGSARRLWEKHCAGRGKEPVWLWALSVIFFASMGALLAPHTLPESILVNVGSQFELFLGALAATMVGGVLIATCRRFLAVLFIICRVDIEECWLDEVLGILLGGFILFHFGNDFLGIALFALSDLAPGIVTSAWHRCQAAHAELVATAT